MKLKLLAVGVFILVAGASLVLVPGLFARVETGLGAASSPAQTQYRTELAPGNCTYTALSVGPGDELDVTVAATPQPVDFFLINGTALSPWASGFGSGTTHQPCGFAVTSCSFDISGTALPQTYYLVFESRSANATTDVLTQSSAPRSSGSAAETVPALLLVTGGALALVGSKVPEGRPDEGRRGPQRDSVSC